MVLALKGIPSFPGPVGTALMRPLHGKHSTPLDAIIQAVFNAWKTSYNVDMSPASVQIPPPTLWVSLQKEEQGKGHSFLPQPALAGARGAALKQIVQGTHMHKTCMCWIGHKRGRLRVHTVCQMSGGNG